MESLQLLANLCKYSYKGIVSPEYEDTFINAKAFANGNSKMVYMRYKNALVFAVRGTVTTDDIFVDADMKLVDLVIDGKHYGRVHRGFLSHINRLWPKINSEVSNYLETFSHNQSASETSTDGSFLRIRIGRNKIFNLQKFNSSLLETESNKPLIVFTGHSLGACCAISALMTSIVKMDHRVKVRCVTFGSPMIGDAKWASEFHQVINRHFRVVHQNDIIAKIPFGKKYKHLNNEVRLGPAGSYLLTNKSVIRIVLGYILFSKCCRHFSENDVKKKRAFQNHLIDEYIRAIDDLSKKGVKGEESIDSRCTIGSIEISPLYDS